MRILFSQSARKQDRALTGLAIFSFALFLMFSLSAPAIAQSSAKSHRKKVLMVEPQYPAVLKNGHFQGQVRIEATVLANGNVSKVEVKGGNPMLSEFASQAVLKWKYAPGPAETIEEITFNFNANQ